MPAQSGDPVATALQQSIMSAKRLKTSGDTLVVKLGTSMSRVFSTEIKYECNSYAGNPHLSDLKSKYIVLSPLCAGASTTTATPQPQSSPVPPLSTAVKDSRVATPESQEPTVPTPKQVLFSPDSVQLGWKCSVPIGAGFSNLGNTCYLNSTLQALFHVPAFVNWLTGDSAHFDKCEMTNGMTHSECLICAMAKTLQMSHKCTGSSIKPMNIYSKLKAICKHLVHGHQEDAHEFLRYLIEGMERSYLTLFNGIKLDTFSKETTPLNQIFGGYMRTEVACLVCHYISTTFQHFQDILLDIRQASSVEEAFEVYFAKETLGDGDPTYKCEQCKKKVAATKKFSIERPPKVLCIQLKRFGVTGGKNNKHIALKQCLDISKYRYKPQLGETYRYKLVSLVNHIGHSTSCGHYTAVGQSSSGSYYLFDDTSVRPISLANVLNTNPYILIYELDSQHTTVRENLSTSETPSKLVLKESSSNSNASSLVTSAETTIPINGSTESRAGNSKPAFERPAVKLGTVTVPKSSILKIGAAASELANVSPSKVPNTSLGKQMSSPNGAAVAKPTGITALTTLFNKEKKSTSPIKLLPSSQQTPPRCSTSPLGGLYDQEIKQISPFKPIPQPPVKLAITSPLGKHGNSTLQVVPSPSHSPSHNAVHPNHQSPSRNRSPFSNQRRSELRFEGGPPSLVPYLSGSSDSDSRENSPARIIGPIRPPGAMNEQDLGNSFQLNSQPSPQRKHSYKEIENKMRINNWSKENVASKQSPCSSKEDRATNSNGTDNCLEPVRVEVDRSWEIAPVQTDIHSPAGSASSGRWSVTSTDKEKTPEKQSGIGRWADLREKQERIWDVNKNSNSTVDTLMQMNHRGYGSHVQTWNGDRSEVDKQVESDRNLLKRSHSSSYDDDLDRGKARKIKKFNNHDHNRDRTNKFQQFQNRQNWMRGNGNGPRQNFYKHYTYEKSNGHHSSYYRNNGYRNRWH